MRLIAFLTGLTTLMACCSTTCSAVTLGYVDNGPVGTGLRNYTLTATGEGIAGLSRFTIGGDLHQVFGEGGNQSDWIGDGSASAAEVTDSHVVFGNMRYPDLGGEAWDYDKYPGGPPDKVTLETITGGGNTGLGTLNNSDSGPAYHDLYSLLGPPPSGVQTVDLIQIVVQDGTGFSVDLDLVTATGTEFEIITLHENLILTLDSLIPGDANGDGQVDVTDLGILASNFGTTGNATWATADFTHDGDVDVSDLGVLASYYGTTSASTAVPEPSAIILIALGMVTLLWHRLSSR